jgi:hypothetical protein
LTITEKKSTSLRVDNQVLAVFSAKMKVGSPKSNPKNGILKKAICWMMMFSRLYSESAWKHYRRNGTYA